MDWLQLWILFSTWCTLSGWVLSLLGILNRWGYGISFLLFGVLLWLYAPSLKLSSAHLPSVKFRFLNSRHWLPKLWLLLAVLAFAGGLFYHPNNYDYLTYRFPRVLTWCWDQKWHWIVTPNQRVNLAATGFEWLMAPLFVLFQTDRLFFLINTVSFLLFPWLIYSVFYRMGISKRVSWWWMWVLPSGYCYALQAGSVSNDLFAAIYTLASFLYILKIQENSPESSRNFSLSCLALALATGAKISNLPLGLPWLIALFIRRNSLLKIKPVVFAGTFLVAGCVSFLPNAILNISKTGTYTGDPRNLTAMQLENPVAGLVGNSLLLGLDNFRPPVWPSQVMLEPVLPLRLKEYLDLHYSRLGIYAVALDQIQIEESAGVGLSVTAGILLMIGLGCSRRFSQPWNGSQMKYLPIALGTWAAVLVLMLKLGNEGITRLITPYYPLLIAGVLILLRLDGTLVRHLVCKLFAGFAVGLCIFLIVISPARPLFPTNLAIETMAKISPSRAERMDRVYSVYGARYDIMKDLRILLPDNEKAVGFIQTGDNMEAPLWRPFGLRQIIDVLPDQTLQQLENQHIHLIVAGDYAIKYTYKTTVDDLTKKWSASILVKKEMILRATAGPEVWYIIALPQATLHP